jgi:hypothetical protein
MYLKKKERNFPSPGERCQTIITYNEAVTKGIENRRAERITKALENKEEARA